MRRRVFVAIDVDDCSPNDKAVTEERNGEYHVYLQRGRKRRLVARVLPVTTAPADVLSFEDRRLQLVRDLQNAPPITPQKRRQSAS